MIRKIYNLFASNLIVLTDQMMGRFEAGQKSKVSFEIIVISKDRPFSLRSFFHSLIKFFSDAPTVTAVICASDSSFKQDYDDLLGKMSKLCHCKFIYEQTTFKDALLTALSGIKSTHVMLCVDDQVFFRSVQVNTIVENLKAADIFTLRLGQNTNYSYNLNEYTNLPDKILETDSSFHWVQALFRNDFHYAFSFDTTVMKKSIVTKMTKYLFFRSPNQLECYMNYSKFLRFLLRIKIGAFKEQKAVNFVLNKVQNDNKNRSLAYTLTKLTELYETHYITVVDESNVHNINSSHDDRNFVFEQIS